MGRTMGASSPELAYASIVSKLKSGKAMHISSRKMHD